MTTPTLCLNMIVKNENKIIHRLLESVLPIIDTFCICDTGSTDNTCEIIESFFEMHGIKGKIITEPFKNFEHNRNFSLLNCIGMSDYILLLDADMTLDVRNFNKNMLSESDSFTILQGSDQFYYQNMRIIKNNGLYKYVGVTHEYIQTPNNNRKIYIDKTQLFINDYGDGGCKSDKFERDVLLLTNGLIDDPTNVRYHFYLANSYYNLGKNEEAIETYKKRIEMGGWNQEVWYSYYRIGICYKNMGKMPDAIYYWLEGYNYLPERLEALYEMMNYYRVNNKPKLAIAIYNICKSVLDKKINIDEYLFLQPLVYSYKIYYEYTVCAAYVGITNINNELMIVLNECKDSNIFNNVLSNMKFYKDILTPIKTIDFTKTTHEEFGTDLMRMNTSSSSIIKMDGQYIMNVRMVKYTIDNHGNYHYHDFKNRIITMNKYLALNSDFTIVKEHQFKQDYIDRRYIGIEDVRIYQNGLGDATGEKREIQYIGTGYHQNNKLGVVYGTYNLDSEIITDINEINCAFTQNNCEKNWVFTEYDNKRHIIYKWNPLQLCKLDKEHNVIQLVKEIEMPHFFSLARGSTCGSKYEDETWFVLHIVSYEHPRHYYHCLAVFDNNMSLKRYSAPFKFKGEPIEYCIGLIVEEDRVIMTYSCWDRTTQLSVYDKSYINDLLKYS
jgi:tetratricopeptide (TPR) repeat protein